MGEKEPFHARQMENGRNIEKMKEVRERRTMKRGGGGGLQEIREELEKERELL